MIGGADGRRREKDLWWSYHNSSCFVYGIVYRCFRFWECEMHWNSVTASRLLNSHVPRFKGVYGDKKKVYIFIYIHILMKGCIYISRYWLKYFTSQVWRVKFSFDWQKKRNYKKKTLISTNVQFVNLVHFPFTSESRTV